MGEVIPFPVQNNNPSSTSGKGAIYDAVDEMDVAPVVQKQIDATESFLESLFGISIGKFVPGDKIKILDMRRHPDEYADNEAKPMLERVGTVANDPVYSQDEEKTAA